MMDIFNWFGSLLGYLLWFLYGIVRNYGVAIILFTLIVKVLVFPFSVKQQKSMASQAKVQKKVKELQKIYANDKMKLNEEVQKLYQKEGVSMSGGCLTMLIPYPILLGIYYAVLYPLRNALHISASVVNEATQLLDQIPGLSTSVFSQNREIEIIKHFSSLREYLTMFSADDISKIESFSHGFKFLGLDLLATPASSSFSTMMWIIPALCLVTSLGMQIIMMKLMPTPGAETQQQGCMKWFMYAMSLFTAYLAFTMPGAVGFYWIIQNILGVGQSIVTRAFFGQEILVAKGEAARIARRELEEAKVKALPADQQIELRRRLEAKLSASGKQPAREEKKQLPAEKKSAPAQKGKAKAGKGGSEYLGRKK